MLNKGLIVAVVAVLASAARPAAAAKPVSCGSDVGLNVTIAGSTSNDQATPDAQLGSAAYRYVSDGGGVYSNGARVKGGTIAAIFQVDNCTYDFTMNLSNLSRKSYVRNTTGWTPVWFFNFDRVASVPITASDPNTGQLTDTAAAVFCSDNGIVFDPQNPDRPFRDANGVHDNYAGCGTDADGQWYVLRAAGMSLSEASNSSTTTHLKFNVSPLDNQAALAGLCPGPDARCATSLVRVYHPTPTSWTIVPHDVPMVQPSPAPNPALWVGVHLTCGASCTPDYFLSTPFKITIARQ